MISVTLAIYDVTPASPENHELHVVRESDDLIFRWSSENQQIGTGAVKIKDWAAFVEQIRKREPNRWAEQHERLKGPMGEHDMPSIMRLVTTTPTYQLFLPTVDIAAYLWLHETGRPESKMFLTFSVVKRFGEMIGFVPTAIDGGQLFVVPDNLIADDNDTATELMKNGKIGRVTLSADKEHVGTKHYIPYSVPTGYISSVSHQTRNLWDLIRKEYYSSPTYGSSQ